MGLNPARTRDVAHLHAPRRERIADERTVALGRLGICVQDGQTLPLRELHESRQQRHAVVPQQGQGLFLGAD